MNTTEITQNTENVEIVTRIVFRYDRYTQPTIVKVHTPISV